jgi:hypothetical protein
MDAPERIVIALIFIFFFVVAVGWLMTLPITRGDRVETSFYFVMGFCWLVMTACLYIGLLMVVVVIFSILGHGDDLPWDPTTMGIISALLAYVGCFAQAIELSKPVPVARPVPDHKPLKPLKPIPMPGKRRLPPGLARYYEHRERQRHCA